MLIDATDEKNKFQSKLIDTITRKDRFLLGETLFLSIEIIFLLFYILYCLIYLLIRCSKIQVNLRLYGDIITPYCFSFQYHKETVHVIYFLYAEYLIAKVTG
jgi:hypothetical protein